MSMERQFKSAKAQLTLVGDKHPKGIKRLFNNVSQNVSGEQLAIVGSAIESLAGEKCTATNIITTDQFITAE